MGAVWIDEWNCTIVMRREYEYKRMKGQISVREKEKRTLRGCCLVIGKTYDRGNVSTKISKVSKHVTKRTKSTYHNTNACG